MSIHRRAFQVLQSPALQQAISTCAPYSIRNPSTETLVHQIIHCNVQHLLSLTSPSTSSASNLLTGLQSYQFIRLFDSPIRKRSLAEATEATTTLWAEELRTRACATNIPLYPLTTVSNTVSDWQAWMLQESIRPPIVTTFLLRGVYNYLKTGTDIPTIVDVFFTLQKGLWDAQSEAELAQVKIEGLELPVFVDAWDEAMTLTNPDDLEQLGVLVMSMLWGLPATRAWLRCEQFEKYGLEFTEDGLGTPQTATNA